MIDIKCKKENLIKFKNEKNDCSTIDIYSNLIKNFNKNNQQNNLLSKLSNLIDKDDNENKTEIENYKIDDIKLDYQNIDNQDKYNNETIKENLKFNNNDFQNKIINSLSNKKTIDESDNIISISSQQNNQNLRDRSSPNSSNSQQPTTSQQINQQTNQQKSKQSIIHQTHSSESHNVHFSTNKNENKSTLSIGHFSIYLDRLDYEFRPSDILTGKLHILLESGHLNLRCVVVYLKGISSVKFTEREYQSNSQSDRHFEDVEYWSDHFLLEMKCRPRLSNIKILEPGEYHLPFKFQFPSSGLPSSFESAFGYIRYWIYAEIRSKDKNRDSKDNHNEEDSNIATTELPVEFYSACTIPIEELRRPINAEQLKVMGFMGCCTCLFRNPDFIQVRANLMHQGQQKGSSIQVNLFVVNRSNKQIIPYVILKSKNEFRAVNKTKINEIEIIGCPGNSVKPGETIMQSIQIPLSYELPIIYDSPNIIITYRIKISIEIPNSFDINFHLPFILINEKLPIRPTSSNN